MLSQAVTAPFGLLIPLTTAGLGALMFAAGAFVPIAGLIVGNIVATTFRQQYTPPEMLGRVTASMRFLVFGTIPLGGLLGGALGSAIGIRAALWCLLGAAVIPGLLLVFSPGCRSRVLPRAAGAQPAIAS